MVLAWEGDGQGRLVVGRCIAQVGRREVDAEGWSQKNAPPEEGETSSGGLILWEK